MSSAPHISATIRVMMLYWFLTKVINKGAELFTCMHFSNNWKNKFQHLYSNPFLKIAIKIFGSNKRKFDSKRRKFVRLP